MRAGEALSAALLCLFAILALQVSAGEDLYWEGEEDSSNEFLEVKEESALSAHLRRLKRGFFDSFFDTPSSTTTPAPTVNYDSATEDQQSVDDDLPDDKDDDFDNGPSGMPDNTNNIPDLREKTLRVTFVVVQPYRKEYSNRDSEQFQTFSKSLADAVNLLFDDLPGIQKTTLVRIQSCVSDTFSCKVTLDISTTGYDNTDQIAEMLRDHIRNRRMLGSVAVLDTDFSANVVDPVTNDACASDELRCNNGRCVSGTARCNGYQECSDGSDEDGCPVTTDACAGDEFRCNDGRCVSGTARCNGYEECSDGSDEDGCPPVTNDECATDEFRCDGSRCVSGTARCNGYQECSDGSDEAGCPPDDWSSRGQDQSATSESGGANEAVTLPPPEPTFWLPWQTGRERGENGNVTPGRDLVTPEPTTTPRYESPVLSDTCSNDELRCDQTRCVALKSRCDKIVDCYDGTDEKDCGEYCRPDDFRCNNGKCIEINRRCDGVVDCEEYEDEQLCQCRQDEFRCTSDGSCIEGRKRCDSVRNCPDGSDEQDCGPPRCSPNSFTCEPSSSIPCAARCNGLRECDGGEDEDNCHDCEQKCDGDRCLDDNQICDGIADCTDGTDELQCAECDGPDDFRCKSSECINANQRCNGVPECDDQSDEHDCNTTMIPTPHGCAHNQFQCNAGNCIDGQFLCDGHVDCYDKSDEDNCPCRSDEWQCVSGQCISESKYCDGAPDCPDNTDETNCATARPIPTTTYPPYQPPPAPYVPPWTPYQPPTTARPVYTTTSFPYRDNSRESFGGPVALNLKTYPDQQTVRNVNYQIGGDVVFQCRDEGPQRVPVRWVRDGGRPLKPGSTDRNGRLEINKVTASDSGVYICQAVRYLGLPGAELRVELHVDNAPVTQRAPIAACTPYQATCGNGQCISKSAVCDGRIDCHDGSDEDSCHEHGLCEPNQFRCKNRKCVLKTWLCDNEDDCGDGSDEEECEPTDRRDRCLAVEFKCDDGNQCVPRSFHCDGQSDCTDGSDEIGCAPVHVTKPPLPAHVRLQPGETLVLVCEAVGVPTPLISWRLNWGHVPPKCSSTSRDGVGTLTCPNMQPGDSGAYSCEAINNKGTTFATPDSIVTVISTDVCPSGSFNSEARSETECITCFCFGESKQCRSADLFTYDMPTPLGEGGTRLVGLKQEYNGETQIDSQPITDQYYYQSLRNGATVTKLANFGTNWNFDTSRAHPYLTLPESYNGNQLTSYGGRIKYRVAPHSPRYGSDDGLPTIVIKGKYQSLVHRSRIDNSRDIYVDARLTPENWQKAGPRGLVPASREDIMMALDNIELILLRADINNAGVNITDFAMESAQHINVGLGAANLVEECVCPPGYEGLSCQKCASGYVRQKSGPWLGDCVREELPCPAGTYGSPSTGYGCRPCPCPLTNPGNQFARTCALGPNGDVVCDCAPGYGGRNCEYCERGYIGNPMISGDSCQPEPTSRCNPVGTLRTLLPDECQCKDQVQGRYCDHCKNDSFYLSPDFSLGCALCFCTGVSQHCMSSNLRRKTTAVRFNTPQIVDQVRVYSSAPLGPAGAVKYNVPIETTLRPSLVRGDISLVDYDRSRPTIYYWSLPPSFAGDKVTAYGGYLRYTLRYVSTAGQNSKNHAADVQLISDNRLTFHYFGNFVPTSDGALNASVQFLEKGWHRSDGKEISREHFLLALADVKAILVKATYTTSAELASLDSASIETAESTGNGPEALHVEQCICPPGYVGTSCEDCAPGYTRSLFQRGLYLEHCERCNCNDHSNMCHPETGECYDCKDNTAGEFCEECRPGYERNEYQVCAPAYETTSSAPRCNCDPRGEAGPCDASGYCNCKQNVEGAYCDRCRPGSFGLDGSNPQGCLPCYCSGAINECHEASHYSRIPIAAPIFGDNYGGYTITDLNADQVINDQFVPAPNESELNYIFSFPPRGELYWSLPVFPGNRVLSYGGSLSLTQSFKSRYPEETTPGTDVVLVGDSISIYWSNPTPIRSDESLSYQVPLRESGWFILNSATPASRNDFMTVLRSLRRVLVRATLVPSISNTAIADVSMDTATESYESESPAAKGVEVCMCPEGYSGTSCETCLQGYYRDRSEHCTQCNCNGHDCQLVGPYDRIICNCRPPYSGPDCAIVGGDSSTNATIGPPPPEPTVTVRITSPTIKIQEVGSSVNFTCEATSRNSRSRLPVTWSKSGGYLPLDRSQVDQRNGMLLITNLQESDSGVYICQTSDGVTTAQAIATLKVPGNEMTPPSVTIEPAINEYYEGDRIELQCLASGNPTPRVSWQRGSTYPLPLASETYDGLFIIPSAKEEDAGEYRCIAMNTAGSTDRTAIVTIRPRPSWPTRDRLTVSPTASTVTEGQSTRLVCTGTTNVAAGTINWIRQDGTEFLSNVRSDNGVLYIEIARPENQGVYLCQATSSHASAVPVLVTIMPLGPLPETSNITVSVDRVKIPTGGSGTVDCNPTGYPVPLIRWKKHQGDFGAGVSQRESTLIISNAQDDDQGYYLCEGIVNGSPVANIYVFVEIERREGPEVEIWPQGEQAVALGSPFEFHCRVMKGIPEPDVMWGRTGGRPLSTYAQIQPHNVLRFERVEVNDEGQYTCTATNVAGINSASAVLKVRSTPEILITPNSFVQAQTGDSVTVECRASGYPEPFVSIRSSPDQREIVPKSPNIAVLRIGSVSDRDAGEYICSATSPAGTIEEEFVIRVESRGDGGFGDSGGSGDGDLGPQYPPNNEPSSMIAFAGQDREIECSAPEGNEVTWRRVDKLLQRNAVQQGAFLIIYNASKSDSGEYECTVMDSYTREVQNAAYTRLQVVAAPRITLQPKTQTVHPGQSPTVECVVDGDDIMDVTWRPLNRPLSRRVQIRESTLIFHQIEVEDAGQYECLARSRYANSSAAAEVIVSEEKDRDTSESHDNEQFAHVGAAVQLSCNVTQPNLRIQWTKDGRNVPRSVRQKHDGSLFIRLAQKSDSGHYVCLIRDDYGRQTSNYINLHIEGPREEGPSLVTIDQPRRQYRVGDNVEVVCRAGTRGTHVTWERYSNNQRQYVDARVYGDGSMLVIRGVEQSDAGVYRCTGRDPYGRTTYEDFNLEVQPASTGIAYPIDEQNTVYTANLGQIVDLPCKHNLEQPVYIQWRREYTPLPAEVPINEPNLHLSEVSESDAGTYVCRVSNDRGEAEARATLRVVGVVPQFDGDSYLALDTLKDVYRQFDIEISFKPRDEHGLILYNSQNPGRTGKYLALQLIGGVPNLVLDIGDTPVVINGDRPLQLNTWHTIRLSRTNTKVTMDVDNTGPFSDESSLQWDILELNEPLYIGGVPDYDQLPAQLAGASGFYGCVSMLVLGREEKNIMVDSIEKHNVKDCDSCAPNLCLNNGVCQEARNERGYMCLCAANFGGVNCERAGGEACRPGLCGPGRCANTADGYKCACPVTYTGTNCDVKQSIEYPAFTGSAYLAIRTPKASRVFRMSMKIKASAPVTDGIIMYCAESAWGYGGFMSLAVHDKKLEFRYGDGNAPIILTANKTLPANEWTNVNISRIGAAVALKINYLQNYEQDLVSPRTDLHLETPMYVGGVDDSIVLNNNTGVTGGFSGCIKDVVVYDAHIDIVNSSILSANVQECSTDGRGDIPEEVQSVCRQCKNEGYCTSSEQTSCTCRAGYTGVYCESRAPPPQPARGPRPSPCAAQPCRNGGTCRTDHTKSMNYTCDCPLRYAGTNCHIFLQLHQSVGFNGDGYLELPSQLLNYDNLLNEEVVIALRFYATKDGVLLYQREASVPVTYGDFILLRVEQGKLIFEWNFGSGLSSITDNEEYVLNGESHLVVIKLLPDHSVSMAVDNKPSNIGTTAGMSNLMNADSNVYIGGIPEKLNVQNYPGITGCVEQIELMDTGSGLNLEDSAVTGRNTQRCRK